MLIDCSQGVAVRLLQAQFLINGLVRSSSTAAAVTTAAREAFIPPWVDVLLPAPSTVQKAAQVKSVKFLSSAYSTDRLLPPRWPEVAVLGRSNVGKSSLVNYLLGSSSLAKVSATPGRTSSINHYLVNNSWCLVDCPGYGYANKSEIARADWHAMTQAYLKERSRAGLLVDVLLLIDASLPPREMDLAGTQWLLSRKIPVTLIYTKCDKVCQLKAMSSMDLRAAGMDGAQSEAAASLLSETPTQQQEQQEQQEQQAATRSHGWSTT